MTMKKTVTIIAALLLLLPAALRAGTPERISRILDNLPVSREQIPAQGTFACAQLSGTLQFYTESRTENGETGIVQVGARLFSDQVKKAYDPVIMSFVERLWVELLIRKTTDSQKALLKEYGVRLVLDGYPLGTGSHRDLDRTLGAITSISSMRITTGGNEIDLFMRTKSDATLHIYIPADRDLLFPYDKKEHEELLISELKTLKAKYTQDIPESDAVKAENGLSVTGGDCYMIDSLRNDVFLTSAGKPVFDKAYPEESMRNMLMGALPATVLSDISLDIRPHTYDREIRNFQIPMSGFLGYFQQQGLKFYSAAMNRTNSGYQCILVMYHPVYNYLHMFSVSFTADQLFSGKAVTLKSDLSAFIPQHNIKNLFQEK